MIHPPKYFALFWWLGCLYFTLFLDSVTWTRISVVLGYGQSKLMAMAMQSCRVLCRADRYSILCRLAAYHIRRLYLISQEIRLTQYFNPYVQLSFSFLLILQWSSYHKILYEGFIVDYSTQETISMTYLVNFYAIRATFGWLI